MSKERPTFTFDQKLEEIGTMIYQRKKDFPRAIAKGRMKQEDADRRIDILKAVARDLKGLRRQQQKEAST